MATKKKGLITVTKEWRKHLRDWKKLFWNKERRAAEKEIRKRLDEK